MAIVDKNSKNWYKVDRDEDVFIGLKLPFVMGNGLDASTLTTIEAVKQNLLNLCSTEAGERVMQPNLGVKLKRFLFEPFSEEIKQQVKEVVLEAINYWLPFLIVNNIIVDSRALHRSYVPIIIIILYNNNSVVVKLRRKDSK